LGIAVSGCSTSSVVLHPPYSTTPRKVPSAPSLIFLSDTQAPLWFEKLWLTYDDNELATGRILEAIVHDSSCTAVVHLGDLTAMGSFDSYWNEFDQKTEGLRQAGIPLYPAFGNHEYMTFAERGKVRMVRRFPFMATPWYERRVGSVAIIILNSNFSHLSEDEQRNQQDWYERTLLSLDCDSTISVVLVGCHHPPYSNSKVITPSEEVPQFFVPAFMKSTKARLFLSGHSHAFEHFRVDGKDFLVIGGAGGLLHPLLRGSEQRESDLFDWLDERRFFHYVRCTLGADTLNVQVLRLNEARSQFEAASTLHIPFNP
jgi:predicted phosphodiesterase